MTSKLENLELGKEYDFDVTVEHEGEFFSGHLSIRSNLILLKVSGERGDEKRKSMPWSNLKKVKCKGHDTSFLLMDLRSSSGISRVISKYPLRTYFEITYEVGYVIHQKSHLPNGKAYFGINIHSETISKWLGNTQNQEKILEQYQSGDLFSQNQESLEEFSRDISGMRKIGVGYNASVFYSSSEFKAGITFPPSFFYKFSHKVDAEEIIHALTEVIDFFTFVTGGFVSIEKIDLFTTYGSQSTKASLYFHRHGQHRRNGEYIFYPLGRNLRFDTLGLPPFPLESIENFFSQEASKAKYFRQYLKYQELDGKEERFLGYFRLLEAISHKEGKYLDEVALEAVIKRVKPYLINKFGDKKNVSSFLKRLPRWNATKYSTERCIDDLFKTVPATTTSGWKYTSKDIKEICKLRNDITHANDYEASEEKLSGFTRFLEVLAAYSLLMQIGIEQSSATAIINRLTWYHEILHNDTYLNV